jgi:hypothetical protein
MACGLDIGTMNLVASRPDDKKNIHTQRIRDCFIDVPKRAGKMLKLSGASHIETESELLIIGDEALQIASVFGREARRPLKDGIISPTELKSAEILGWIIHKLIGDPKTENEICVFGCPADPIDRNQDTIYHRMIFTKMLKQMGYTPIPSNEAMAIIFAEGSSNGFTGLSISFGSGMTNIALAIQAVDCLSFSVSRGGDWIDNGSANACGCSTSKITSIKENGVDLIIQSDKREKQAIVFYYVELIDYVIKNLKKQLLMTRGLMFSSPIPIYISGGTSKAGNFIELFKQQIEKQYSMLPFDVSEIIHAQDPLSSVSHGLLVQAMQEEG